MNTLTEEALHEKIVTRAAALVNQYLNEYDLPMALDSASKGVADADELLLRSGNNFMDAIRLACLIRARKEME